MILQTLVRPPKRLREGVKPVPGLGSKSAGANRTQVSRDAYAVSPGRYQNRLGAAAFWLIVGVVATTGVGSLATRTYTAFHNDMRTRLLNEQAQLQFAYEDRIAELRAQIDRITSQQLLDQGQVEQKIDALLKRQVLLEQRTSALSGNATTPRGLKRGRTSPQLPAASSPTSDKVSSVENILSRVSLGLVEVEQYQATMLASLEKDADSKLHRIHDVFAEIGVKPRQAQFRAGTGGPFVPLKAPRSDASAFDRQLYHVNLARAEIDRFKQVLDAVPVRKPVNGDIDTSSLFGVRSDPFFHRPAMHTGLDLRGDTGEPVQATASGRISIAGRDGGYGNLVEINHGNGLATRYGHLSKIDVKVGQRVHIGQIIGEVGSTGRSTGPHLHYETRINGRPIDPQKFLHAGIKLGGL